MTDRQMRYIVEIAKEGSISDAAKRLFISQPSLSNLLAHVENELGVKIFDRSVTPMMLTFAGEKYIEAAEKVLIILDELRNLTSDINESRKGRLRIGCGQQQSPFVLPLILPEMFKRYPGVEFHVVESSRKVLEESLQAGRVDVLLVGGISENPQLVYESLITQEFVLIAPREFNAAILPTDDNRPLPCIDLSSLADSKFVMLKKGHQLRVMQDRIFQDMNFTPNVLLETDHWQTALRLVESGTAFTILPNAEIEFVNHNFDRYSIEKRRFRHTYLCYSKNAYISNVMRDFIALARQTLADSERTA